MAHHIFGPSGAHRWSTCVGSTALIRILGLEDEDTSSSAAEEGTAAHAVAEHLLYGHTEPVPGAVFLIGDREQENDIGSLITEEMLENTRYYRDYVLRIIDDAKQGGCNVRVEEGLTIPLGADRTVTGTADAIVFAFGGALDGGNALHVIDLKYGRGVAVSPVENSQLMLYAAGALSLYKDHPVSEVVLHIVQPRIRRNGEPWYTTPEEVMAHAAACGKAAGEAEALLRPEAGIEAVKAALTPSDDACKFCKAKAQCPAFKQHSLVDFADLTLDPTDILDLPLDQLAADYAKIAKIEEWITAVRARALAVANSGQKLPGFKLVQGKMGARKWKDEDKASSVVESVVGADVAWKRTLLSPAQFEKAAGKGGLAILKELTVQSPGSPTLVPETDPRPELTLADTSDFDIL